MNQPPGDGMQPPVPAGMMILAETVYQALLDELASLRQENDRLRRLLLEAQAAALAGERSEVGSSLLRYVLDVLCTLLRPQRAQVSVVAAGQNVPPLDVGPLQRSLEQPAAARAQQGQAERLTTRYESVLWLPITQGGEVVLVLCLRRSPADPFTGLDQALGEALAPLLISALQTGHHSFDLGSDAQALATLSGTLVASVRGGGGRVAAMARDADQLAGRFQLGPEEHRVVWLASILHDIGTVDLAEDLMHREGRLDAAQLAQVRDHPGFGAAIIEQVAGLEPVAALVLAHHERWDGAGYPRGLAAGSIPLGAQIISVVDAFHAMTNPRTSRRPRTPADALDELRDCAGTQFDERVVEEFTRMVGVQGAWPRR